MFVKLSSKGQVVIPRDVRDALGLKKGTRLQLTVRDGAVILQRADAVSPLGAVYGRYAGENLLEALEQEHRQEVAADENAARA